MSETKFHALSGVSVLIAIAVFIIIIIGIGIFWYFLPGPPPGWASAGHVDWSTNPDATFEATGIRPKDYTPRIDTTYKVYAPEGMMEDAKKGFLLGLDVKTFDGAKFFLPPDLFAAIKDSLTNGGIVKLWVIATDSGLVFSPVAGGVE